MSEIREDQEDSCQEYFEDEHLQEYLKNITKTLGISSPKYRIKSGSSTGDNWIGIIYRVIINGEKNGVPVKIQTIFKVPSQDDMTRLMLQVGHFFPREHLFYSEIVTVFKEFLNTKEKSLENIPECYLSSDVEKKEVICLQDLQPMGFVMRDRIKQLDFQHINLALRALGRLHALSFALRDQKPEIFASKIATLKEVFMRKDLILDKNFANRYERLGNLVKTALAEEDPKYTERFSEYLKNSLNKAAWSCDGDVAEPYAVLNHGDFWMNNILFKYDEDSEEPKDLYFIDFQLARYASPVADISYILFCSCSQDMREKHFDELIKIYHESLSAYLSELGSDPKKLFPFDALLNQMEKFSVHGAGMAILVLSGFTAQGEDVLPVKINHDDVPQLEERIQRDHFWRNTLRDTFKDLIDRNYI